MSPLAVLFDCLVDESALASPGRTRNPDGVRSPGMRVQFLNELSARLPTGFDYRDRLGNGSVVSFENLRR
jgi:hypothetical protein